VPDAQWGQPELGAQPGFGDDLFGSEPTGQGAAPVLLEHADVWALAGRRSLRDLVAGPAGKLIADAFRVSPRQDRAMETVERLLAACEAIIRRKGRLDGLTIETIAEEASVTPQAAYRYFHDAHDLILLAVRRVQAAGHERLLAVMTARIFDAHVLDARAFDAPASDIWADLAHAAVALVLQDFQALAGFPAAIRDRIARDYHDICYDQLWTLAEVIRAAMADRGYPCAGIDAMQLGAALTAVVAVAKLLFLHDAALLGQPGARQRLVGIFLSVLGAGPGQCAPFDTAAKN